MSHIGPYHNPFWSPPPHGPTALDLANALAASLRARYSGVPDPMPPAPFRGILAGWPGERDVKPDNMTGATPTLDALARDLLAALPACRVCSFEGKPTPALLAAPSLESGVCDAHAVRGDRDLHYAAPLRALMARVGATDPKEPTT